MVFLCPAVVRKVYILSLCLYLRALCGTPKTNRLPHIINVEDFFSSKFSAEAIPLIPGGNLSTGSEKIDFIALYSFNLFVMKYSKFAFKNELLGSQDYSAISME